MKWVLVAAVALGLLVPTTPAAAQPVTPPIKGADASWPNCPKGMGIPSRKTKGLPMPKKEARFVILGLTNGPGFYPNPCLASQVDWARKRGIWVGTYALTTYPKPHQLRRYGTEGPWPASSPVNRLRNAGYAQAVFNLDTMARVGLTKKFVWVDVEFYPVAPWSASQKQNKAVLDGVLRGYEDAGVQTGIYATPGSWNSLIGAARYGLPEWHTAGGPPWSDTDYGDARRKCNDPSVQGGPVLIGQWWNRRRDFNLLCPRARTAATVDRLFTWMSREVP